MWSHCLSIYVLESESRPKPRNLCSSILQATEIRNSDGQLVVYWYKCILPAVAKHGRNDMIGCGGGVEENGKSSGGWWMVGGSFPNLLNYTNHTIRLQLGLDNGPPTFLSPSNTSTCWAYFTRDRFQADPFVLSPFCHYYCWPLAHFGHPPGWHLQAAHSHLSRCSTSESNQIQVVEPAYRISHQAHSVLGPFSEILVVSHHPSRPHTPAFLLLL